ncbi:MAG TPA: TetR family transcriptional regulator [Polyangia bacterium]|jgi:AcrR family transcriptional regulator|nr:TetR family transcriptional regulator [Polyangia bacterium]
MIAALVEVARERGAGEVTVAHIVARSGVSRRTFYELFTDRETCFLAAFEEAVQRAALRVVPAFSASGSWRERVRGALGALLEFLEDEPGLGALCVVDALGAGPLVLERRARVVEVLIEAIDEGRGEVLRGARPTRLTAECVVGAILAVLHARLAAGSTDSMSGLLGPLMATLVLPYQGQAAAAREAAKSARRRGPASPSLSDPLRELDMRLTYRTVQVLLAIAAHPGASNRQVADAADVTDQGQISKLLARLEHLGLTHNTATGSNTRGEPNAWTLTPTGWQIEQTINQQAEPIAR